MEHKREGAANLARQLTARDNRVIVLEPAEFVDPHGRDARHHLRVQRSQARSVGRCAFFATSHRVSRAAS